MKQKTNILAQFKQWILSFVIKRTFLMIFWIVVALLLLWLFSLTNTSIWYALQLPNNNT